MSSDATSPGPVMHTARAVWMPGLHLRPLTGRRLSESAGLELAMSTSGATQHVLLDGNGADRDWVYKLPAVLDCLLPADPVAATTATWRGRGVLHRIAARPRAGPGVGAWLRHRRVRAFLAMIDRLEGVRSSGAAGSVADWSAWRTTRATITLGSARYAYRGPLLKQRRAEPFFVGPATLHGFDREAVVAAQRALWRAGFAAADAAAALGPDGWGVVDGRVCLCDTGSLTSDLRHAVRIHSDAVLDPWTAFRLDQIGAVGDPAPFREYAGWVRPQITAACVATHWPRSAERRPSGDACR
jgi:hypothetical protein